MSEQKQKDHVRYTIRVPADLYASIKDAAGEKSVNAEIIERLSSSDVTLRDMFAGQAMAALIIANGGDLCALGAGNAKDAYGAADAMIKVRGESQ